MRAPATPPHLDLTLDDLRALLARVRPTIREDEYQILEALVETYGYLTARLDDQTLTIDDLRQLLGRRTTEKTRHVLTRARGGTTRSAPGVPDPRTTQPPARGHGRHGAAAYGGATRVTVSYGTLSPGDMCPECQKGKVYVAPPRRLVRIVGQAPLTATVYELEKLRCNLCGERFAADPPADVGPEKYDASAASMIALLKYGNGMPFHRVAALQRNLDMPLPASTQWEILAETATVLQPAFAELQHHAAHGEVLHNDDTSMRVLALRRDIDASTKRAAGSHRDLHLGHRGDARGAPHGALFHGAEPRGRESRDDSGEAVDGGTAAHSVSDALARNVPKLPPNLQVITANCLAHGRRQVVDVVTRFPEACQHILEALGGLRPRR